MNKDIQVQRKIFHMLSQVPGFYLACILVFLYIMDCMLVMWVVLLFLVPYRGLRGEDTYALIAQQSEYITAAISCRLSPIKTLCLSVWMLMLHPV